MPVSEPESVPVSEPEPESVPVSEPEPEPVPVSEPEPEPAPVGEPEPDEFTKLEGIGPYYRDALHKLGIMTFAQLAQQTDAKALVERLKSNGFRQHASIPTWAEQAGLAAAGDWEGLAALQAQLDGGRRAAE